MPDTRAILVTDEFIPAVHQLNGNLKRVGDSLLEKISPFLVRHSMFN